MVEIEFFGCAPIWGQLVASYDRIFRELDIYFSKDRLVTPKLLVELRAVAHSCMVRFMRDGGSIVDTTGYIVTDVASFSTTLSTSYDRDGRFVVKVEISLKDKAKW